MRDNEFFKFVQIVMGLVYVLFALNFIDWLTKQNRTLEEALGVLIPLPIVYVLFSIVAYLLSPKLSKYMN